jgi:hypothetical protein
MPLSVDRGVLEGERTAVERAPQGGRHADFELD